MQLRFHVSCTAVWIQLDPLDLCSSSTRNSKCVWPSPREAERNTTRAGHAYVEQGLHWLRNQYQFWRETKIRLSVWTTPFLAGRLKVHRGTVHRIFWFGWQCVFVIIFVGARTKVHQHHSIHHLASPVIVIVIDQLLLFFCYAYAATNNKIKYQAFASSSPLNP